MFIPYCTDNEGSAYCMLNDTSKKWPATAVVMELLAQSLSAGVQLAPTHVRREFNQWADRLVNSQTHGFNTARRLRPDREPPKWLVLDALIQLGS